MQYYGKIASRCIHQVSTNNDGNKSHALDYICNRHHENKEVLEDLEATDLVKVWISERNRMLSQKPPLLTEGLNLQKLYSPDFIQEVG